MKTSEADKYIKTGFTVIAYNARYNEVIPMRIISRDRYTITTTTGGRFDREELEILATIHKQLSDTAIAEWSRLALSSTPIVNRNQLFDLPIKY